MKFGVCCSIDKLSVLKKTGYDYAEFNFAKLATCPEDEFKYIKDEVRRWNLPAEAFNGFFRPEIRLNGDVDYEYIKNYCNAGFARAKQLGGAVAVLGSGGARQIPEGYDRTLAEEQFVKVLRLCGDAAAEQGMTVAIEPLRKEECNFINTVEEGMEFVHRADHPNVRCLADFYHVFCSGESLSAIENAKDQLAHVHLAAPVSRNYPCADDGEICRKWSRALKICGYGARISLEGKALPDFETAVKEAKAALELFR